MHWILDFIGRWRLFVAVVLVLISVGTVFAEPDSDEPGLEEESSSEIGELVSAEEIELAGAEQYDAFLAAAAKKKRLLPENDERVRRVVRIAGRLLPFAKDFNERAQDWEWEVNVVRSDAINAFCMPGGKVGVFTGILDQLALTDDETAAIIGHEIAHAVREHARARAAAAKLKNLGAEALGALLGDEVSALARLGTDLLSLKFSRDDELDADLVGMELAALAGFDPRAAITLWEKFNAAAPNETAEFLSTHPAGERRIATIEQHLPEVMPIYEAAIAEAE